MRTQWIIAATVGLALASLAGHAATPQQAWSTIIVNDTSGSTNIVHQVIADGNGGCVLTYSLFNGSTTNWNLLRFDKKGKNIQSLNIPAAQSIELLYCDKKVTVFVSVGTPTQKFLFSWDTNGNLGDANDAGITLVPTGMEYTKGSGSADRKGYFAIKYTAATKQYMLLRLLYKYVQP